MPKHRSAATGRKVSSQFADENPLTTVKEGKSKDAKRLEWMQYHGASLFPVADGSWKVEWPIGDDEVNSVNDATVRRAIDAAMRSYADAIKAIKGK